MFNSHTLGDDIARQAKITSILNELYQQCLEARNHNQALFNAAKDNLFDYLTKLSTLGEIVEIDNTLKEHSCCSVDCEIEMGLRSIRINVSHTEIIAIKFTHIVYISTIGENTFIITWELKNGEKSHFFVKQDLSPVIEKLIKNSHKENIEIFSKKMVRNNSVLIEHAFWSTDWEKQTMSLDSYHYSDRCIMDKFEEYILPFTTQNQSDNLVIVDAGGGKGRLALKLIALMLKYYVPFKYVLIEPSHFQCLIARDSFSNHYEQEYYDEKIQIINSTLKNFSESDICREYLNKVDLIISSGGPINMRIVTKEEADENFAILQSLLAGNGKIIATGLSDLFLTKKDFTKHELKVLSSISRSLASPKESGLHALKQCYVIQKPAGELDERMFREKTGLSPHFSRTKI